LLRESCGGKPVFLGGYYCKQKNLAFSTECQSNCSTTGIRSRLMLKQVQILNMRENKQLGIQYFEIHEVDPTYKIDRIVYREKSPTGWFKELSAEVFKEKTQHLQ
jgi:hypothetical protein